jgi:hypothetical protein
LFDVDVNVMCAWKRARSTRKRLIRFIQRSPRSDAGRQTGRRSLRYLVVQEVLGNSSRDIYLASKTQLYVHVVEEYGQV